MKFDNAQKNLAEAQEDEIRAEICFKKSKRHREKLPDDLLKWSLLIGINVRFAQFLVECGKLEEAQELNNEALSLLKKEYEFYDLEARHGLSEGLIQYHRGNITESQQILKEGFKTVKQNLPRENVLNNEFREEYFKLFHEELE